MGRYLVLIRCASVMALVTYILISALQSGIQHRFHPEVLGSAASRGIPTLCTFCFPRSMHILPSTWRSVFGLLRYMDWVLPSQHFWPESDSRPHRIWWL
jgi:hypothetical protein